MKNELNSGLSELEIKALTDLKINTLPQKEIDQLSNPEGANRQLRPFQFGLKSFLIFSTSSGVLIGLGTSIVRLFSEASQLSLGITAYLMIMGAISWFCTLAVGIVVLSCNLLSQEQRNQFIKSLALFYLGSLLITLVPSLFVLATLYLANG